MNKLRSRLDAARTERFLFAGLLMAYEAKETMSELTPESETSFDDQLEYLFDEDVSKASAL